MGGEFEEMVSDQQFGKNGLMVCGGDTDSFLFQ